MKNKLKLFGWGPCPHKQICPEYNLDWEQKPIKILGVTFTADVCNIWEHNAEDIIHKINKMINAWSKRKLTLPGIAKFTHLFLALPNPPGELIKYWKEHFTNSCGTMVQTE